MTNNQTESTPLHSSMISEKKSKTFSQEKIEFSTNSTIDKTPLNNIDVAGRHFIVDFYGASHLTDLALIEKALIDASHIAGATLLHIHLHKFTDGGGITGVALLAESHISVHTWPERDYAAFDVFMCGEALPEKAVSLLEQVFQPSRTETQEIFRGKP